MSHTGTVEPRSPNQRRTCSGLVCASQTSSRGALKYRVSTISVSEGSVTSSLFLGLLSTTMTFLLCVLCACALLSARRGLRGRALRLELLQVLVQAFVALLPEATEVHHVVRHLLQRRRFQPARAPLRLAPL